MSSSNDPSKHALRDYAAKESSPALPNPQSVRNAGLDDLNNLPMSALQPSLPNEDCYPDQQLNDEADDFITQEYDAAGEKKIDANGHLQGGRKYKIRTFTLPSRGEKLFMLGPECARIFRYQDSDSFFNQNKSLYRIIAQLNEKWELVDRDILPYSYLTREVDVATARSVFRLFGSRAVRNGVPVQDDYWETKAQQQELGEGES